MTAGSKTPHSRHRGAHRGARSGVLGRWVWLGVFAVSALVVPVSAVASPASAPPRASRLAAAQVRESVAGGQLRWLLAASTRLPIGDAELREHFSKWFGLAPRQSPADL